MTEHRHPNYRKIYFTLLFLLAVSVAGPFVGIKWVTLITAFGIAVVKANMVIQNFMHLKWEKRIAKYVLAVSLLLMALFWGGVAPDVMKHAGLRWTNDAAMAATERGIGPAHTETSAESHDAAPAAEHEAVPAEPAGEEPPPAP
jgi:caa(3)-type oxidase subunit IV